MGTDMSLNTVNRILTFIIKPLLSRHIYKEGLYEIVNLLKITVEKISASDMNTTYQILKLYNKIFSHLPIHDIEDMKKKYFEFKNKMNEEVSEELFKETLN